MKPTVGSITRYLLRNELPLAPVSPEPGWNREADIAATGFRSSQPCQQWAEWFRRGQRPVSLPLRNCDTCHRLHPREWRFPSRQLREIASSANGAMTGWLAALGQDESGHHRPPRKHRRKARPLVATDPPWSQTRKQCPRESLCRWL